MHVLIIVPRGDRAHFRTGIKAGRLPDGVRPAGVAEPAERQRRNDAGGLRLVFVQDLHQGDDGAFGAQLAELECRIRADIAIAALDVRQQLVFQCGLLGRAVANGSGGAGRARKGNDQHETLHTYLRLLMV